MKMTRARRVWLAGLALAVAAACSSDGGSSEDEGATGGGGGGSATTAASSDGGSLDGEFVVGVIAPTSGAFGTLGQGAVNGFLAAADEINAAGGIDGREVVIEVRDSAGDVSKAVLAATELVDRVEPDAVFAGVVSTEALGVVELLNSRGILNFTTGSSPDLNDPETYPYTFVLTLPHEPQLEPLACLAGRYGERAGLVYRNDPSGTAEAESVAAALEDAGIEVVGRELIDPAATDITPQLERLRGAGADVLTMAAPGAILGTIMRGLEAIGWDVPTAHSIGSVTGDLTQLVPAGVQGQFHSLLQHFSVREGDELKPYQAELVELVSAYGEVDNITMPIETRDVLYAIKHAVEAGGDDIDAQREALEAGVPGDLLLSFPEGLVYSAEDHGTTNPDNYHDGFWYEVSVSAPVDGTYLGEPLTGC